MQLESGAPLLNVVYVVCPRIDVEISLRTFVKNKIKDKIPTPVPLFLLCLHVYPIDITFPIADVRTPTKYQRTQVTLAL